MQLEGKVAVVTGSGSGIGRGIAERFAREGAAVGVWDLNGDSAAETASLIADAGGIQDYYRQEFGAATDLIAYCRERGER